MEVRRRALIQHWARLLRSAADIVDQLAALPDDKARLERELVSLDRAIGGVRNQLGL
jgi:hypothetical protein